MERKRRRPSKSSYFRQLASFPPLNLIPPVHINLKHALTTRIRRRKEVEITPIKNWLELEFGTTALFQRHSTEWGTDLLFKKPWDLSPKMEFMIGIGPEWNHSNAFGLKTNSVSAEAVGDFMFWPSRKHRFGWYLEPTYEYNFARGHEQSVGITGGLLISIP